ncbi:IS6 family transposase [Methylovulum psychrotolerans]|uniref:IS6 family transposase n=1 Tax=Methylovulum psychrotolerans TaxID=1704499 RepID=A0A1Z4BYI1_9GAMM|nr:IS6 family transposase [Methylovulum psychrotolerans]ASF46364.1 IS6 family transposase [Methylovulum psychrotolerans]
MKISFKGAHYPKDVILHAVFFYVRYGVSYRDLEEILAERGVTVDHATLNRWVVRYSPLIALAAKSRKRTVVGSWRMDETYIKIKGEWAYLYRAVDKFGDTVDFMLSERRDEAAATAFFRQAIDGNGLPEKVVMDKSGSNLAGLENINVLLVLAGLLCLAIEICQVKYLNNRVEQDHRFIKKITGPMLGFKSFRSAQATLDGIETTHMIRKGQLAGRALPAHRQFINLAG